MIKCYFGTPGVGKTTLLAKIGIIEIKRLKKRYRNIYVINAEIQGLTTITKEDFIKYRFQNDLILWDEITLDYDNRNFKSFTQEDKEAWLLHRHMKTDIFYFTQNYENVDKKIRDITQELWYMNKSVIPFFRNFTTAKRIYRTITITEQNADLVVGYRFCNLAEQFFTSNFLVVWRPKYYKYFDSFDLLELDKKELIPWENEKQRKKVLKIWKRLKTKYTKKKIQDGLIYY